MAERKRLFTLRIFGDFYKLGDHDTQNKYLFGLLRRSSPKQQRLCGTSGQAQSNAYCYSVAVIKLRFANRPFVNCMPISKRRVELICSKLSSGVIISGDGRGKHSSQSCSIAEELKVQVREHISSFPCRESHYSRHDNQKRMYTYLRTWELKYCADVRIFKSTSLRSIWILARNQKSTSGYIGRVLDEIIIQP